MTYELTHPLVFVDTETAQLEPIPKPWEIALIKRGGGAGEERLHIMLRQPDLSDASPDALRVNRFYERHPLWNSAADQSGLALMDARDAASAVELFTAGTQLVGSNPDFDARALDWLLRQHGLRPRWRHHTINLVTLTYPVLHARGEHVQIPSSSYDLSQRAGAEPPQKNVAHTAMGDALWTVRWWDSLMGAAR
ncbi:3'-5' exonuclease [Brachybacterium tyrofermentans]|uniref:3'-5' exonuclease n=1 Tax=Brachybacterium tyrofermentans TaxID=47848 RepID=UPI003FB9875A